MTLKRLITTAFVLLFFASAYSQSQDENLGSNKNFYVRVFGSYGFLTSGSFKAPASQSTTSQNGVSSYSFTAQKKGMGAGLRFGAGFGYVVSKVINIGIDGEYLMGSKLTSSAGAQIVDSLQINSSNGKANAVSQTSSTESYQLTNRILSIIPSITFKAISTQKYYIYTRVGIIVAIPLEISVSDTSHSLRTVTLPATAPAGYNYYTEISANSNYKYKSNPGIGYQAALGIAFKISNNFRFYAEAVSNSVTLHPVEYDQTYHTTTTSNKYKSLADKTTVDHSLNIQQFKSNGVSTITVSGTAPNQVSYYQSPQISVAVNSLNLGAGLIFTF